MARSARTRFLRTRHAAQRERQNVQAALGDLAAAVDADAVAPLGKTGLRGGDLPDLVFGRVALRDQPRPLLRQRHALGVVLIIAAGTVSKSAEVREHLGHAGGPFLRCNAPLREKVAGAGRVIRLLHHVRTVPRPTAAWPRIHGPRTGHDGLVTRTMLLDTASLYFRAFYGVPDTVRAADGSPANAVRGLLDIITKLVTTYRPDGIVACWDDDWRPQWRVDLIPTYKAHRVIAERTGEPDVEETPDDLTAQIPAIRAMLDSLGIPIVGAAGYEADDIIGTLATRSSGAVDIVTGDRDLFQLVDDARGVRVIYTARGMSNLEVVTDETIVAKYGIRPDQYADFATMRGDASDGLPGVAGVGEKTAAALLQQHGSLAGILTAAESGTGMSAGVQKKILAAAVYLEVAPTVVAVARAVDIDVVAGSVGALGDDRAAAARELAEKHGYASALERYLAAISA